MPRMIDLVRKSEVPSNLMHAAARGALSVAADEAIEILVYLAMHNKVFGDEARITLAGWDEKASIEAASNSSTSREVLEYLVSPHNLRPHLLPVLVENPSVSAELLVPLASDGTREVVEILLRSPRAKAIASVLEALRTNPNLTDDEARTLPTSELVETTGSAGEDGAEANEVLEKFLAEHAAELEAEASKPFQPIGGVHEEIQAAIVGNAEITNGAEVAETITPPVTASAAQPMKLKAAPTLAKATKKPHPGIPEKRDSTLQKIAKLDIKGRIQLAMKGTKEERSLLVRDGTKLVALAVLESPKISDGEVERISSQKNVLEAVLRAIPMKRRYAKQYTIIRNLVFNPRTPMDVSLGLVKNLLATDLKNLAGNKEVSETIRKMALRMSRQKAASGGKK